MADVQTELPGSDRPDKLTWPSVQSIPAQWESVPPGISELTDLTLLTSYEPRPTGRSLAQLLEPGAAAKMTDFVAMLLLSPMIGCNIL